MPPTTQRIHVPAIYLLGAALNVVEKDQAEAALCCVKVKYGAAVRASSAVEAAALRVRGH